jgi:hypothetical protein
VTINLNIEEHIYKLFSILKIYYIYLDVHYQDCQNNPLSTDPFSVPISTTFCIHNLKKKHQNTNVLKKKERFHESRFDILGFSVIKIKRRSRKH